MVNTKIIKVPKEKGGTTVIYNNSGSAGSGGSSIQTATELEYHYLWGQPFNGTQDVNGSMEVDGNVTATNLSAIHSVSSPYVNVSEILRAARADVSTLNASDASITNLDSSNITTEYLTVTKQAHFFELIIDELRAVGGQVILSPARAKIELVEQQNNGSYICYFLAKDSDGEQVRNNFLAND